MLGSRSAINSHIASARAACTSGCLRAWRAACAAAPRADAASAGLGRLDGGVELAGLVGGHGCSWYALSTGWPLPWLGCLGRAPFGEAPGAAPGTAMSLLARLHARWTSLANSACIGPVAASGSDPLLTPLMTSPSDPSSGVSNRHKSPRSAWNISCCGELPEPCPPHPPTAPP